MNSTFDDEKEVTGTVNFTHEEEIAKHPADFVEEIGKKYPPFLRTLKHSFVDNPVLDEIMKYFARVENDIQEVESYIIKKETKHEKEIANMKKSIAEAKKTPGKILNNLEDVDTLMQLMKKNKIDYVSIEGNIFTKTQHEIDVIKPQEAKENDFWANPLAQ